MILWSKNTVLGVVGNQKVKLHQSSGNRGKISCLIIQINPDPERESHLMVLSSPGLLIPNIPVLMRLLMLVNSFFTVINVKLSKIHFIILDFER